MEISGNSEVWNTFYFIAMLLKQFQWSEAVFFLHNGIRWSTWCEESGEHLSCFCQHITNNSRTRPARSRVLLRYANNIHTRHNFDPNVFGWRCWKRLHSGHHEHLCARNWIDVCLHCELGSGGSAVPLHRPVRGLDVFCERLVLWRHRVPRPVQPGFPHHAREHLHLDSHVLGALSGCREPARHLRPVPALQARRHLPCVALFFHPGFTNHDHDRPQERRTQWSREAHVPPDLADDRVQGVSDRSVQHLHLGSWINHRVSLSEVSPHLLAVPNLCIPIQRHEEVS